MTRAVSIVEVSAFSLLFVCFKICLSAFYFFFLMCKIFRLLDCLSLKFFVCLVIFVSWCIFFACLVYFVSYCLFHNFVCILHSYLFTFITNYTRNFFSSTGASKRCTDKTLNDLLLSLCSLSQLKDCFFACLFVCFIVR